MQAAPLPAKPPRKRNRNRPAKASPTIAGDSFEPTAEQRQIVVLAKGTGMTDQQIRALIINPETGLPISKDTLKKHFPVELEDGKAQVVARVARNLVGIAMDRKHTRSVTAGIFYLKTQARWREPEPETAEMRRIEAEASAQIGDQQFEVRLILEERPEHIKPVKLTDEQTKALRE